MVCESCQAKIKALPVPDKWKDGSRSAGVGGAIKAGKTNKLLEKKSFSAPYVAMDSACKICKSKVLPKMHYCNNCAYKKGMFQWIFVSSIST